MRYDLSELRATAQQVPPAAPAWLKSKEPVVLYGAGNFGQAVLAALRLRGVPVAAFIDGKLQEPAGRDGLTVYPLDHPAVAKFAQEGRPVLLTVFNHLVDWSELVGVLGAHGFSDIATPMEIFDAVPEISLARYWIAPRDFYLEEWRSFIEAEALWCDETSRELYRRILWFRWGRDLAAHPVPHLDCQYVPRDLPRWPEPVRLLDGGACRGEALQNFSQAGYEIAHYYGWEPDLENFRKLENYLQQKRPDLPATLLPCGLSSKTSALAFSSGKGTASALTESGTDRTVVLRADQVLRNQPVTLIKLDIEGAEMDALHGMRAIIERDRPGLAICVYHRPDDIIRLPALVNSWKLSYRLHLRIHCWNTFDSVLYALPT